MVAPLAMLGLSVAADLIGGLVDGGAPGTASGLPGKDKLQKTAKDFETVFLEQTLDRLTEAAGEDGPLGNGGTGGSVYRSMLVKEHAGQIVKSGGIGLADSVYRQMLRIQEGASRG
ncbi:rod-binding protein [Enterovirga sp.]|jgi:flagellar protein FlgJ|uniref:rod-binding protein n=1 Tax=Enterovirga sp. TaxID=2026350 RepID=UPI0026279E9F|nr:rod-binding protein [Enterovirga sp.]MDB5591948.1 flagellar biosynthesis protein FlgJ [Enterovirga sp.]